MGLLRHALALIVRALVVDRMALVAVSRRATDRTETQTATPRKMGMLMAIMIRPARRWSACRDGSQSSGSRA
jgi:hypothetical protein